MPVNDRLVRQAVLVVQDLQDLWEGLDDPSVFIAIHLDDVDQSNLCLGSVAERLENRCRFLMRYEKSALPRLDGTG